MFFFCRVRRLKQHASMWANQYTFFMVLEHRVFSPSSNTHIAKKELSCFDHQTLLAKFDATLQRLLSLSTHLSQIIRFIPFPRHLTMLLWNDTKGWLSLFKMHWRSIIITIRNWITTFYDFSFGYSEQNSDCAHKVIVMPKELKPNGKKKVSAFLSHLRHIRQCTLHSMLTVQYQFQRMKKNANKLK